MKFFSNLVMNIKYRLGICQHEGCWRRNAVPCFLTDYDEPIPYLTTDDENYEIGDDKPAYYYCTKHAPGEGFCWVCGQFWAGIESFDFIHPGLCDNCSDTLKSDFGEDETEDEYADDFDYDELFRGGP